MATQGQFNQAQQQPQYSYGAPKYTNGISSAQEKWANSYVNNANPNDIGRYQDYVNTLGLSGINQIHGQGANIQAAQRDFMNQYGKQIANGTNNIGQLQQYNDYLKAFGGTAARPSDSVMKQLSISALNGSRGAAAYLKAMGLSPQSGTSLWSGYDPSKLTKGSAAYQQYETDNPYSALTKGDDNFRYNQYSEILRKGQQLDNNELNIYKNLVNKWNLTDMSDKMQQDKYNMQQDKTNALNAQNVALNQTMSGIDAKNFQTMQQAQQAMSNRGIADSGLAQDAYQRATMAANQDYQKAYSDAATKKSDLAAQYDSALQGIDKQISDRDAAQQAAKYQASQDAIKNQSTQDQFLTAQTGYVWMNGKPLTVGGKTISTMDYQKLSETQRHDIATENNTAVKNNNDYSLGILNNNTANAKIQSDASIAAAKLEYDYKNLDFKKTQWQQDVNDTTRKLDIAQQNANSTSDKNTLSAINSEIKAAQADITATQKAGGTPSKKQTDRLEAALGKADDFIGGK